MTVPSEPTGASTAPVLRTGEVVLRALAEHDVPALVEQERDPLVRRWSPAEHPVDATGADRLVQATRQQWAARSPTAPRRWAVAVGDGDGDGEDVYAAYAGQVEYVPDGRGSAEVGFVLHPGRRGRGLAARALALAVRHAHEVDGVHTLHWRTEVGNWPSRRVVWRVGFRVEGTIRGVVPGPGHPRRGWWGTRQAGDPVEPAHPWWVAPELAAAGVVLRPADEGLDAAAAGQAVTWVAGTADGRGRSTAVTGGARFTVRGPVGAEDVGGGRLSWWWPGADGARLQEALSLVAGHAFRPMPPGERGRPGDGLGLRRLVTTVPVGDATGRRALHGAGWRAVGREHAAALEGHLGTGAGADLGAATVDVVRFELLAGDR